MSKEILVRMDFQYLFPVIWTTVSTVNGIVFRIRDAYNIQSGTIKNIKLQVEAKSCSYIGNV